jgi:hypothetical protein
MGEVEFKMAYPDVQLKDELLVKEDGNVVDLAGFIAVRIRLRKVSNSGLIRVHVS